MAEQKSAPVDYYADWLGLPAGPRPPDHYALLGLAPYEAEPRKISEAAGARLRMVRQYGLKFPKESTDLLNEIAAAEVCLLDPASKAKYDEALKGGATLASAPVMVRWYLQRDNQVYGPFPDHQMREMARTGYVTPNDLVWNEKTVGWVAAQTVEGLVFPERGPGTRGPAAPAKSRAAGAPSWLRALGIHLARFYPYQLRNTQTTADEQQTLAAAGVNENTAQLYAAWRRTMLLAITVASLFTALVATLVALLETEFLTPNWLGSAVKTFRVLALFALPVFALAAAVFWSNQRLSRWLLIAGWSIASLPPLVFALLPYQYLLAEPALARAQFGGTIQFCRVLAVLLSLSPAVIRAGLWLKSLRPARPVGAWCLVGAANFHFAIYSVAFVALIQMCGDAFLTVAAFLFIIAPVVYVLAFRRFARPADSDALLPILATRGVHLLIWLLGLNVFVVFISTRSLGGGTFGLIGRDAATALFPPGTIIQLALEFLARSFFTSLLALDLLEVIVAKARQGEPVGH